MDCPRCRGLLVPEDDAMRCVACGYYEFPEMAEPLVSLPSSDKRQGLRYQLGTPRRKVGRRM